MQDDIDMEPLHKLFIYRKKLVKPPVGGIKIIDKFI